MPARIFGGMSWPIPSNELEWRLRYGNPARTDMLAAAEIVAAYQVLIAAPRTRSDHPRSSRSDTPSSAALPPGKHHTRRLSS
ncbi:MAG: hypothetical protein WC829_02690 [Hyphomicrobium sp.]|jgi:hypothetical protein